MTENKWSPQELISLTSDITDDVIYTVLQQLNTNHSKIKKANGISCRTVIIKGLLAEAGIEIRFKQQREGFRVYANKLCESTRQRLIDTMGTDFTGKKLNYEPNKEWLFDMIWCIDDNEYGLESLELAVECEWLHKRDKKDEYGHIKYDFQKLLVATTRLCIMIFKWKENDEPLDNFGNELNDYFEKAILNFKPKIQDKKILCIGYSCDFDHFTYKLFDC